MKRARTMYAATHKRWREPDDHAIDLIASKKSRKVFTTFV